MRRLLGTGSAVVTFALCVAVLVPGQAQDKPAKADSKPEDKASIWMKAKLRFSQNILEGLTRADFEKVRSNASALSLTGYLEKWVKAGQPEYKRQMALFELASAELVHQADEKSIEGATLAYNGLTISCVQCHRVIRDAK